MKWSTMGASAASPTAEPNEPNEPSGDDRMLAAAAHASNVIGMLILVPAAIFVIRRKDSPFVAFHALQATLVSIAMMGLGLVLFAVVVLGQLVVHRVAQTYDQMMGMSLVLFLVWAVVLGVPWLWSIIATLKAWGGKRYSIPIIGAIARRLMGRELERGRQPREPHDPGSSSSWSNLP